MLRDLATKLHQSIRTKFGLTGVKSNLTKGRITGMSPSRLRMDVPDLDPNLMHGSLDPHKSAPEMSSRSVHPLLRCTFRHRHTDHATCDI